MKLTEEEKQIRLKRCAGKSIDITNPELLKEWDYEANEDLTPQMISHGTTKLKTWWKCSKGHKWEATVNSRCRGTGCPCCANRKILVGYNDLATLNPNLIKEWNYEKNSKTPQEYFPSSNKKVWWKCSKGHEWEAAINDRSRGHRCPYCCGQRVLKGFNDIETTNPEILTEWDYSKNTIKPYELTKGSKIKPWFICSKGHSYQCAILNKVRNKGCPYCAKQKVLKGFNDLATKYPNIAATWDYDANKDLKNKNGIDISTPDKISYHSSIAVNWKCKYGHKWKTIVNVRCKFGCPKCNASVLEKNIYTILDNNNIMYDFEKTDGNARIYDFYMNFENDTYVIESDGKQHFQKWENSYYTLEYCIEHDNSKNVHCLNNNMILLRIPWIYENSDKLEPLILDFLSTKQIPQEIIDFYAQYDFSNYAEIAKEMNRRQNASKDN